MSADNSVLIFGAGGFVGSYLAKEFKEHGYEVFGSDLHGKCKNCYIDAAKAADLTDTSAVTRVCAEFEPRIIVNLAAISSVGVSWKNPQTTMQVNVVGTLNVLDAARAMASTPKVLLIGSSEEYASSGTPLTEEDALDATNPYGISKMTQERIADIYEQHYGLRIYRTRSFNHTGVGQPESFVLPSWCKQVAGIEKSGGSGVVNVGNVDVRRDFSDVRDVVCAYRMLVETELHGEVFNIGSGRTYQLRDLAYLIASFSSSAVSFNSDVNLFRPSDNPIIACDPTKAKVKLGWKPSIELSDTLREMYEHFLHRP